MEDIKYLWARIFMTSLRNIDRVIASMDRTVDCLAMQGGSANIINYIPTEQLLEKIIDCIYRKQGLINLKVISEEILKSMKEEYVEILRLKFIKNRKFQDIADNLNISLRTVFRHYEKALSQFACYLKIRGFTDERLNKEYSGDPYIEKIKNKIYEEYRDSDKAIAVRNNNRIKRMLEGISIIYGEEAEIKL